MPVRANSSRFVGQSPSALGLGRRIVSTRKYALSRTRGLPSIAMITAQFLERDSMSGLRQDPTECDARVSAVEAIAEDAPVFRVDRA